MNVGWGVDSLADAGGGSHVCCCEAVVDGGDVISAVSVRRGAKESEDSENGVKLSWSG